MAKRVQVSYSIGDDTNENVERYMEKNNFRSKSAVIDYALRRLFDEWTPNIPIERTELQSLINFLKLLPDRDLMFLLNEIAPVLQKYLDKQDLRHQEKAGEAE